MFASKARSGPTPLRSNRLGVGPTYLHKRGHSVLCFFRCRGSAVSGLRSLSRLWGGGAFALCARDEGVRLQGSLRPDTAPLESLWGSRIAWGSVSLIYIKGDNLYYTVVVAVAPQNQACARRKTRTRMSFRVVREGRI